MMLLVDLAHWMGVAMIDNMLSVPLSFSARRAIHRFREDQAIEIELAGKWLTAEVDDNWLVSVPFSTPEEAAELREALNQEQIKIRIKYKCK